MLSLRFRQAEVFATLVSFTLLINYRWCHFYCRCRCYRRLIIDGVIAAGDKLIADVMESMNIQDKA
jgi:hypothetical protein